MAWHLVAVDAIGWQWIANMVQMGYSSKEPYFNSSKHLTEPLITDYNKRTI